MEKPVQLFDGNRPFKNGSYIYGRINKYYQKVFYDGENTDSVEILVDNQNNKIKANAKIDYIAD